MSLVTSHHKLSGRDAYKVHHDARSQLDALLCLLFLCQHALSDCCIKRPAFHIHFFIFIFPAFRFYGRRLRLFVQIIGIGTDLRLPVYTGTGIFLRQLRTTADLFHSLKDICFKFTMIRSIKVNPVIKRFPFLIGQFNTMMSGFQHFDQLAGRGMIFVGIQDFDLRFRSLAVDIRMKIQITFAKSGKIIDTATGKIGQFIGTVMAGDAGTVQHRLYFQFERERTLSAFRQCDRMRFDSRSDHTFRDRYLVLVFVATDTGDGFSRHSGQPATHPLHGTSARVQRLKRDRRIGRNSEQCGTILFDRHRTQQAFDIPSALNTLCPMVGRSFIISIFVRQHTECFHRTTGYALQTFTFVNILNKDSRLLRARFRTVGNNGGNRSFLYRYRVDQSFTFILGNQRQVIIHVYQINAP